MRRALVLLVLLAAVCGTACGGDDEGDEQGAKPAAGLTLDERVPGEAEAPGSKPDPVETPRKASGPDEFLSTMEDMFVNASAGEKRQFAERLVSAAQVARFYPSDPEGRHSPEDPHLFTIVVEYETEDAAKAAAAFLNEDGGRPCPQACANEVETFEVDGTPDAAGLHRYATKERIDELATDERPHDSYAISFASGAFAYSIDLNGAPGAVTEEQVEEIVEKLHDRVTE